MGMNSFRLHPVTRLLLWLSALLAIQCLSGVPLLLAFVLLPVFGRSSVRRGAKLVWRTRWLLLPLFVVFAWGVPGEPLWASAGAPTGEGLREAVEHAGRLILVLFFVAAFLEAMSLADLLSASHLLLQPLARLGIDPERGVARLMLVLRQAEALPPPGDWRRLLAVPGECESEVLEVEFFALQGVDYLVIGAVVLVILESGVLVWGA